MSRQQSYVLLLVVALTVSSVCIVQGQLSLIPIQLPTTCKGADGRSPRCNQQSDCDKICGKGFQCAGCPGCLGEPFVKSCISEFLSILCAQPDCPEDCKIGQSCGSNADCTGCGRGVVCKSCPVCPGQDKKGTCQKESTPTACPKIGCINCEELSCDSDADCSLCAGDYTCKKCPGCDGSVGKGKCTKKSSLGVTLCPVLDCTCDKRGRVCKDNSDCCPDSEICHKCPPCPRTGFNPTTGKCISRRFVVAPQALIGPICPPCLPFDDYFLRAPIG